MQQPLPFFVSYFLACLLLFTAESVGAEARLTDGQFELHLREQIATVAGPEFTKPVFQTEQWKPAETALIICDMWDAHHCYNAGLRVNDMAGRINDVVSAARGAGTFVIHAPSSCVEFYKDHPARKRAIAAPTAANLPDDINQSCDRIPNEEKAWAKYPIDQSNGGEDDDPIQHEKWAQKLADRGLNPKAPWKRQTGAINIHDNDAISESGSEVWNLLEERNIKNVIMVGVHTNMSILDRPFGLRQLVKNGRRVVLVRDLTDAMYNPAASPFVNHHSGTDLIIEHIERHVCPTILSTDLLGGKPHRFFDDKRPTIAILISEFEYETYRTLPSFAQKTLRKDFRLLYVINDNKKEHSLPGLDVLKEADLAMISIWRRTLPPEQLQAIRDYVASGKPVVAIRTSSHAFATRTGETPEGAATWPEFDSEVLASTYTGHYGVHKNDNDPATHVWIDPTTFSANYGELVAGLPSEKFKVASWLYKMTPLLAPATDNVLLWGQTGEHKEPVAWVTSPSSGNRVFYTSLGSQGDFEQVEFQRLLKNAVYWATSAREAKGTKGSKH